MKIPVQTMRSPATYRLLTLLCASAVSALASGGAIVDSSTQPTMTLAPYVLRNTNLEETEGTRAFRPWFENGAWTGDLLEYEITEEGVRVIRTDVGFYPRDTADWRGGVGALWSARQKFPDWEHYAATSTTTEGWECTEENPDYWKTRKLFTYNDGEKVDFLWDTLGVAQRSALDQATVDEDQIGAEASPILNFVRGDRSKERCKEGGIYRWRFSLLGAIINSRPAYVPAGTDGLVVVGANDGMVHGFNAKDGSETFGYVPSLLLGRLGALRASPYAFKYFVDGELRHRDIGTVAKPRHIVAGGFGAGAQGIFALDVTDPADPKILFETSGTSADYLGGLDDSRLGYIHGRPTIAKLPDGNWYVVTGNGYDSGAATAQLLLIAVSDGSISAINTNGATGLSAPALVDTDGDGKADIGYAGDLTGRLWRFDLAARAASEFFVPSGLDKPITVEPEIGLHPTGQGLMVFFGTGSLLSGQPTSNADDGDTATQSFYGIWDRSPKDKGKVHEDPVKQELFVQSLAQVRKIWSVPQTADDGSECVSEQDVTQSESTVRYVVKIAADNPQAPTWTGDKPNLGWKVDLPRLGERLVGHPILRAERVQFVTTNPLDMKKPDASVEGAGSWVMQLSQATGGSIDRAVFDLNRDCVLYPGADEGDPAEAQWGDAYRDGAGTYFPVGLNLGPYNIAQPALARIRTNAAGGVDDGVYINALGLLPIDEGGLAFRGNIDVTTDSPNGPKHQPLPEPAKEPFGIRPFPEASGPTKPFLRADGLGHRVDGHSFGYNKVHGVDYIDFFELEPRRGKYRLDVGAVYKAADGTYQLINPREAEQELNRITEVGIPSNQKFIVVLANADLSSGNELQIGCRTWPVYEYQTLTTQQLAAGELPLTFTLEEINNDEICENGIKSTLRITPTDRVGKLDVLMGTLPGVVNNTDLYAGKSPNTHLTRKSSVLNSDGTFQAGKGPADLYSVDPHVTPNKEGKGYRWRNGALTIQLLAVTADNQRDFTLQDVAHLPSGIGTQGSDLGWGGVYAKGFTLQKDGNKNLVIPVTDGAEPPDPGGVTSGLLYESSIFWHWGDMARFQTEGTGNPVVAAGYGASGNQTPSLMYETEWFTPGAYQQLTADFNEALQQKYVELLKQLESSDEDEVLAALMELATLLGTGDLADYHRLRVYVPNSKQLQEHHLIGIDRVGNDGGSQAMVDGTPARVLDIEVDIIPTLGPNFQPGRRSWMDVTPSAE